MRAYKRHVLLRVQPHALLREGATQIRRNRRFSLHTRSTCLAAAIHSLLGAQPFCARRALVARRHAREKGDIRRCPHRPLLQLVIVRPGGDRRRPNCRGCLAAPLFLSEGQPAPRAVVSPGNDSTDATAGIRPPTQRADGRRRSRESSPRLCRVPALRLRLKGGFGRRPPRSPIDPTLRPQPRPRTPSS